MDDKPAVMTALDVINKETRLGLEVDIVSYGNTQTVHFQAYYLTDCQGLRAYLGQQQCNLDAASVNPIMADAIGRLLVPGTALTILNNPGILFSTQFPKAQNSLKIIRF